MHGRETVGTDMMPRKPANLLVNSFHDSWNSGCVRNGSGKDDEQPLYSTIYRSFLRYGVGDLVCTMFSPCPVISIQHVIAFRTRYPEFWLYAGSCQFSCYCQTWYPEPWYEVADPQTQKLNSKVNPSKQTHVACVETPRFQFTRKLISGL